MRCFTGAMGPIDFVAYPPTSFPVRDLLVLEQLALGPSDVVCELGIGSGGTTARLARLCAHVTGFEISEAAIEALRDLEARHRNLSLVVADVTRGELLAPYAGLFTRLVACDTLEHVVDAAAFFRAVATLLAPGGTFLITFPNEPRERMHGVTRFDRASDLRALLEAAKLDVTCLASATLTPFAARVASLFADAPISAVRAVLRRNLSGRRAPGTPSPQTFEQTQFHKRRQTWRALSPAINAYWFGVLRTMAARGPCFELDEAFAREPFTDTQVVVIGRKPRAT